MELLIILGLILLNGIFSGTEMAMVSARKTRLEIQAERGSRKARKALKILESPDKFLSTIQIGITLIGILTGIFSGASIQADLNAFFGRFETLRAISSPLATAIIVITVTYFTLVLGELVPKRIGLAQPEMIAKFMAPVMSALSKIAFPFIWLLSISTKFITRILRIKNRETSVTEDEIKAIIEESAEHGEIEVAEQEMIERVFHLSDRNISSLMTHRNDIRWLDVRMDINEINTYIREYPYSVYPICEGNVDDIKGFVRSRDLFALSDNKSLNDLCRKALFVPESNSAYKVMERFKQTGIHICFVVDEYGSLLGMVTLNDMFEAIVGDMPEAGSDIDEEIVARGNGSYWVDAQISFYDFLDYFDEDDDDIPKRFDTLAGFILHRLEHIPKPGERFEWKDFTFEIADMDGQRIDKVLVEKNLVP